MSAETLRKAAAIVRERRLAKHQYESVDGRVCADGALMLAHTGRIAFNEGVYEDERAVAHYLGVGFLVAWSDAPTTTAEDVASAFEAAAARLESQ